MATFNMTFQSRDKPLDVTFGAFIQREKIIVEGDNYEGPYRVTPAVSGQVLGTKYKTMTDDVTIEGIPYAETSNDSGTTVIIAS